LGATRFGLTVTVALSVYLAGFILVAGTSDGEHPGLVALTWPISLPLLLVALWLLAGD